MHADEVPIDAPLVRQLIDTQFPEWRDLPVTPLRSAGTDNAIYRLGADLVVRLPRRPGAQTQVEKEYRWLPKLAPALPLEVPTPIVLGRPAEGYPYHWCVCRWLLGETAVQAPIGDPARAALDLAHFIGALRRVDADGAPAPGPHNSGRGEPLARRDAATRDAIAQLEGRIDTRAAAAAWAWALQAPAWDRPPTWVHGDLLPTNLLIRDGRLSAVIDFGCLGAGDPACDLMAAWTVLPPEARRAFRTALAAEDAMWRRGMGWALSFGVIALPYYLHSNPVLAGIARLAIGEVLSEDRPV